RDARRQSLRLHRRGRRLTCPQLEPVAGRRPRVDQDPGIAPEAPDHLPGSVRVAEPETVRLRHRRGAVDREWPEPEPRRNGGPGRADARRCGVATAAGSPVTLFARSLRGPTKATLNREGPS